MSIIIVVKEKMSIKSLFIRVDANPEIGLGHLVRTLSLAEMLKDLFRIEFVLSESSLAFRGMIKERGMESRLESSTDSFLDCIKDADIVLFDGYHFSEDLFEKTAKRGAKVVCIDDLLNKTLEVDMVINHAPGIRPSDYRASSNTVFLLGPEFALLRPEFLNHTMKVRKGHFNRVLVCFGGSDFKNLTAQVIGDVSNYFSNIDVVIGAAYPYERQLLELCAKNSLKVTLHNSLTALEMRQLFEEVDVAIVPSSGILFEAIAMGIPTISGYYVDNQMGIYEGFKNLNVIIDAKDFNSDQLKLALQEAQQIDLSQLSHRCLEVIDGWSPKRIRKEFLSL